MLDEPQNTRLYTQRAFQGSYNLKDPPGSPKLKYPGPHWVPDSLRASWCAAETLTRCLPHGTPVTYESMCRMLDSVLPHQRECCEDGIELMLIEGCFTPERIPYTRSSASPSLSRQDSDRQGSRRRDSPRASRLIDDILDEFIRHQDELRVELAKSRKELKSSLTSCRPSPMFDASTGIQEQSRRTVLVKEQPKGSSLPDMKPAGRMFSRSLSKPGKVMAEKLPLSPLRSSVHSGPLRSALGERIRPQVTTVASPRVSAPETQNLAKRVQLTRSMTVPSSAEPAPQGLGLNFLRVSIPETNSASSRPSPSFSVRAKAREQSIKTVLDRDFPKGSSQVDAKPSGSVVSAPAPAARGNARTPEKSPRKGEVSTMKRTSAIRHSPVAEAAPTLPKSTPVSYIRAPPAPLSKDGASLESARVFPTVQRAHNAIGIHRVVSTTTYREIKTPSRVSREPASPWLGVAGSERRVGSKATIQQSDKSPSAGVRERSTECPKVGIGPSVEQSPTSASSIKEGEERWMFSIVNIQINKGEKVSPKPSEAPTQMSNPPSVTCEPTLACKPATPSPSLSVCAKAQEQSIKTVLDRESLKGNSRVDSVPSGQVVSAPTPKHRNAMTPMKPSARKVEDSLEKRTSAAKHSPVLNTAITPRKSTSVLSIRPALANSSKDGARSSLQVTSTLVPSSVINALSETTRRKAETFPRLSIESSSMRFGKAPLIGVQERSAECSNLDEGYAVEQALTLSHSTEVGKGQQSRNAAVINLQKKNEEASSPEVRAVSIQSVSASDPSSFALHLPSDEFMPPIEVVSRRCVSNIVSKTSREYGIRSPSLETARKQSTSTIVPFSVEGEGQLARAAAYMRERVSRRSPAFDEFVCRTPRVPPDKVTESDTSQWHILNAVSGKGKANIVLRLPKSVIESTDVLPCSQSKVVLPQPQGEVEAPPPQSNALGLRANEPYTESSESVPKYTGPTASDGVRENDSAPSIEAVEAERHSNECLREATEISEEPVLPAPTELRRHSCESLVYNWEDGVVCFAVLQDASAADKTACVLQQTDGAVAPFRGMNIVKVATSAPIHSPEPLATLALPSLPADPVQTVPPSRSSLELGRLITKSPNDGDCRLRPFKVVSSLDTSSAETHLPEIKAGSSSPGHSSLLLHSCKKIRFSTTDLQNVVKSIDLWTGSPCLPSVEFQRRVQCKPPGMVVVIQRLLFDVVKETLKKRVNSRSPSSETAQKRSSPSGISSSLEGEGQLTRAVSHIQERIRCRSSPFDEFPRCSSKEPPDKLISITAEPRRLESDVVSNEVESEARMTRTFPACRPENLELSRSSPESTSTLPDSNLAISVMGSWDSKPQQLEQAVEAARCSLEHLETESSVLKELVMPDPRILEGEWSPGPAERQPICVNKTETTGARMRSPIASAALTPLACLPAFLSQAVPSSRPSSELSGLIAKSPGEGDCEWWSLMVTNLSKMSGVETRSPKIKTSVSQLVSKPTMLWASSSRYSNIELCWRARCKPPNAVASNRRCLIDVVNISIIWSATWRSPGTKMGLELVFKPDCVQADLLRFMNELSGQRSSISISTADSNEIRDDVDSNKSWTIVAQGLFTSKDPTIRIEHEMRRAPLCPKELVWRVLKPPDRTALRRFLNGIVNKLELRRGLNRSHSNARFVFIPVFHCPRAASKIGS
ncbi:hypothetical protein F5887DRAFT_1070517 [Amanita rubescens]|nr:hypothetical protein F5887DRAFT_1070517 [Amanita rubescens]